MVLASDAVLQWCRGVFGLFLLQGVEGMPAVDPDSSLGKALAKGDKNLARYMGNSWGGTELLHFKNQVLKLLAKRVYNPPQQLDVLSDAFERLITGHKYKNIDPSRGLGGAKAFVLTVLANIISDRWRSTKDQKEDSLSVEDSEGEESTADIPDLSADEIGDMIDLRFLDSLLHDPEVIDDLKTVHPDAPRYLELLLDGFTQKEILGNPPQGIPSMLPHWTFGPSAWQPKPDRGYTTNILRVLRNHALGSKDQHPSFLERSGSWVR